MAKVSASTLVRRASKTKDKAVAKRLRAQAARIRREARTQARDPDGNPATGGSPVPATQGGMTTQPQWVADVTIKELKESLEHGLFEHKVRELVRNNRFAAEIDAHAQADIRIKSMVEAQNINVVSAFLAEMSGIAALNKGPLPRAVMVSGYTLARVVDALRQAGYTEDGKGGFKRPL